MYGDPSLAFREISSRYEGPALEQEVLDFWRDNDIFTRTLELTAGGPEYCFNEGPPTANGKPGIHHVLARTFKDAFPRYKTMRGYKSLNGLSNGIALTQWLYSGADVHDLARAMAV